MSIGSCTVAVAALVLLATLGLVRWKDIDRTTDWGVVILFGGGARFYLPQNGPN